MKKIKSELVKIITRLGLSEERFEELILESSQIEFTAITESRYEEYSIIAAGKHRVVISDDINTYNIDIKEIDNFFEVSNELIFLLVKLRI